MSAYDGKTIAEIIDDYGRVRGDLSEQYARDQLVKIIEGRISEVREQVAREIAAFRYQPDDPHYDLGMDAGLDLAETVARGESA